MAKVGGHYLGLSIGRRLIDDFLYAGQQLVCVPIQRRMRLGGVVVARNALAQRPSWCAIFTKALARVTARHPELRRIYVPAPWPRLFQYDRNVVGIVVERAFENEPTLFLARIAAPEDMSIADLDATLRRFKNRPIEEISGYTGAIRLARLPTWVRRAFWRCVMRWMPRLRASLVGTMGVTVTAGKGAAGIYAIAPWPITMIYDVFDEHGALDVRLTFDHRVNDGAIFAKALLEMEQELCGPILAELRAMKPVSLAA